MLTAATRRRRGTGRPSGNVRHGLRPSRFREEHVLRARSPTSCSFPLIAKDAIKEALMDVLGYPATVEQSRTLGRAAVMAMLNVATESPAGAVLDSTFFPYAFPQLRSLPGPLVEVHCSCPRELAVARYSARSPTRHAGHLDADRQPDELWNRTEHAPDGHRPQHRRGHHRASRRGNDSPSSQGAGTLVQVTAGGRPAKATAARRRPAQTCRRSRRQRG